ncbi:MAG: tail fiber domain-containing protein [Candidatus Woesearchaeota archaeon]|nr:tail fiber domain-containing protein [Candidatus Woesearchaeota archaeon]
MTIDGNGNVGIGDSSPDYGLDVVDDINSDDCFREAGAQVAGTCTSDIRLKKNIKPLQGSLDKILELEPVEFEWKEGIDELGGTIRYVEGRQVGLVAQDVEPVLPHLVHERNGYLSVEYNLEMQMMLVNAIQELKEENQELKQLICLDHPEEEICQ